MKHFILRIFLILIIAQQICAQNLDTIPSFRKSQIDKIVDLIKNEKISQLSDLIQYPLKRPNPIPNIENKDAFILYYKILFDSDFKKKITNAVYTTNNTIDRYDGFGLFQGDIWLNENGYITAINHNSDSEKLLKKALDDETKRFINPILSTWKENIIVCKSDKFLIRIDLLDDNSIRYVSWSMSKQINDKPDLILNKGIMEFQGTMGGVTYSFKNGDWTYIIDEVKMCETDDKCGLFLRLLNNGVEKNTIRLKEIK
jgi:hypothetical protein